MPKKINHKNASIKSWQTPILALNNFTVQRGDFPLCVGVDMSLNSGEICHLIGANGTGKTTLLMQLAGLLPVLEGEVVYHGQACLPNAPLYVSHQLGIHPNLTVAQNLTFLLNLYGINPTTQEINEALEWVDLGGYERMNSNQLSAGQTRRITLARLYLMTPEQTPLWLLDEPFTALDVSMVARLQERIQQYVASKGAVLMTSHQPVLVATKQLNLSDFLPDYSDTDYFDTESVDDDLNNDSHHDIENFNISNIDQQYTKLGLINSKHDNDTPKNSLSYKKGCAIYCNSNTVMPKNLSLSLGRCFDE